MEETDGFIYVCVYMFDILFFELQSYIIPGKSGDRVNKIILFYYIHSVLERNCEAIKGH